MTRVLPVYRSARERLAAGHRVVAATLIETVGSAPLDAGAEMLVDDTGAIEGSITGGCVEAALVEEARSVLNGGAPRVATYGVSDEQAAEVGLMCGGTVRVFVNEIDARSDEVLAAACDALARGEAFTIVTLLDGPSAGAKRFVAADSVVGSLRGPELLDRTATTAARGCLELGLSGVRTTSALGETTGSGVRFYVQSFAQPPVMVIFGAIEFSSALAKAAHEIGYRVVICDARAPFVTSSRYSDHAEVIVDWPDHYLSRTALGPRDVVLVFTHDQKFDEPALLAALQTGAGYIGALGSRRTQADRERRLRRLGAEESDLARIVAPCGLDIGARTPEETAISILAEVIARRTGRAGGPLSASDLPIHAAHSETLR